MVPLHLKKHVTRVRATSGLKATTRGLSRPLSCFNVGEERLSLRKLSPRKFIVIFLFFCVDIILNLKEPKYQFADTAFSTLRSVLTKQDSVFGRQSILVNVHLAITH